MLIHGARAVLFRVKHDTGGFGQWVHRLAQRAPSNKVVVAIANKLARIVWAVLSSGKDYRQLRQIPGFGPLVSTGTVAAVGNGSAFRCGCGFAAWVGVVPRQYSTGVKQKLYGISKRGNRRFPKLLLRNLSPLSTSATARSIGGKTRTRRSVRRVGGFMQIPIALTRFR